VLEDEQIRVVLARQAEHVFVVILNPTLDDLSVFELDGDGSLLFPQFFEVSGLSRGLLGWSRLVIAGRITSGEWHEGILHRDEDKKWASPKIARP